MTVEATPCRCLIFIAGARNKVCSQFGKRYDVVLIEVCLSLLQCL